MRGYFSYRLSRNNNTYHRKVKNLITYEGITAMLKFNFREELQDFPTHDVHVGLINNNSFVGISINDTASTHSWAEFTDYFTTIAGERARLMLTSGGVTDTTATYEAEFQITGSADLKGFFIIGGQNSELKNSTSGTLWSVATVDTGTGVLPVVNGDFITLSWEIVGN